MSFLVALLIGGLAGYVASLILARNSSMGILANIVVGIVGAFIGNFLFAGITGREADLSHPTLGGFLVAVAGSVVLLAIVNLFTRKSIR